MKLVNHKLLSNVAFKFNLRCYSKGLGDDGGDGSECACSVAAVLPLMNADDMESLAAAAAAAAAGGGGAAGAMEAGAYTRPLFSYT